MAKAQAPQFGFELVVIHPFGDHERGTRISEPDVIKAVLEGDNAHHCNKVAKPQ
jgi:hypothetical protein